LKARKSSDVSPEEIAWAAGLFEGEGSFTMQRSPRTRADGSQVIYKAPKACMEMTDGDTVRAFYDVVGVGYVTGPLPARGLGSKERWFWEAAGFTRFTIVVNLLSPWLQSRRLKQIADITQEYLEAQKELEVRRQCQAKSVNL
jgi:hypothetical protein